MNSNALATELEALADREPRVVNWEMLAQILDRLQYGLQREALLRAARDIAGNDAGALALVTVVSRL